MSYFNNLLLLATESPAQGGDPAPLPHLGLLLGPTTAFRQAQEDADSPAADCIGRGHHRPQGDGYADSPVADRDGIWNEGP